MQAMFEPPAALPRRTPSPTDHGFASVALASNVARSEAHAFYEGIGYKRTATSHLFRKGVE
jgi:hypothetical protein